MVNFKILYIYIKHIVITFKQQRRILMLVKMEIDLAKGFAPWKEMFIQNEHRLNAHGGKLVFAGTPSDNENKLTVIMDFESMESLKNFGSDEELTKTRVEAGAMVETGVMTIMNEASFISTKS